LNWRGGGADLMATSVAKRCLTTTKHVKLHLDVRD
jgi:hypothetical protein